MLYISKELEKALIMFDLSVPFVENDLKRKGKALLFKHHPDRNNGSSESEEKTKLILKYFKLLKEHISTEIPLNIPTDLIRQWEEEERDITNIYDPCPRCNGTKFEQGTISVRVDCPNCNGSGTVPLKCKYCKGGMYRPGKPCKACGGTGVWKVVPCRECNPRSFGFRGRRRSLWSSFFDIGHIYVDKPINKPCTHCHGRGKIKLELYNPVIKKGSILK